MNDQVNNHFVKNIYLKKYNCPYLVAHLLTYLYNFGLSKLDTVLS